MNLGLKYFFILRTKWCGDGNIADNTEDLGIYTKADICCRAHDFCNEKIDGYDTKYNLTNPIFYTRLSCKCDQYFYQCLRKSNDKACFRIGFIYFNLLDTQCFRKDYPVVECIKITYKPRIKCTDYKHDITKPKLYQWFDVPDF